MQDSRPSPIERKPPVDLVYAAAIVGFFVICIAYTYAFDRI